MPYKVHLSPVQTFQYTLNYTELDCTLDYEPACEGSTEYRGGPKMEPDEPENAILLTALDSAGTDVYDNLTEEEISEIEAAFLAQKPEYDGPD